MKAGDVVQFGEIDKHSNPCFAVPVTEWKNELVYGMVSGMSPSVISDLLDIPEWFDSDWAYVGKGMTTSWTPLFYLYNGKIHDMVNIKDNASNLALSLVTPKMGYMYPNNIGK